MYVFTFNDKNKNNCVLRIRSVKSTCNPISDFGSKLEFRVMTANFEKNTLTISEWDYIRDIPNNETPFLY